MIRFARHTGGCDCVKVGFCRTLDGSLAVHLVVEMASMGTCLCLKWMLSAKPVSIIAIEVLCATFSEVLELQLTH